MNNEQYLGPDRLSTLPADLVIEILNHLDTKQAVQTSLSLKKWVNLWKLISDLNFDSSVFRTFSKFDKFVGKVLTLRKDSVLINKFSFSRRNPTGFEAKRYKTSKIKSDLFKRVIGYAVSHDVQHLTINFYLSLNHIFPDPLVSLKSLRSFKLHFNCFDISLPLEQLVTLHLEEVRLIGPGNFSNYPNLQNLTLDRCCSEHGNHEWFSPANRIVAPQLSRLMILNCFASHVGDPVLTLSTPKLTFFEMRERDLPVFQTDGLPLLDTVVMNVDRSNPLECRYEYLQKLVSRLMSMLKCFGNVSSVRLSWSAIEVLSRFPAILAREPSPFWNLKSLNIIPSVSGKKILPSVSGKKIIPSVSGKKTVTIPSHVTAYFLRNSPDANTVIETELPRYLEDHILPPT